MEEVKKVVFGIKKYGSPRLDGIQTVFYQKYWEIVGPSIMSTVNEAIRGGTIPPNLLSAFISLIPKKKG